MFIKKKIIIKKKQLGLSYIPVCRAITIKLAATASGEHCESRLGAIPEHFYTG